MYPKSYLFVPGNRPERFEKARASGADAVILDLEDAVAPDAKDQAREAAYGWLASGVNGYVRINAAGTEWFEDDLAALANIPGLLGLVVPKAEDAESLSAIATRLPQKTVILPLLETATGFDNLKEISRAPKVQRLLFGTLDFQVDMGIQDDGDELNFFRSLLTLASRVARIAPPVDGVTESIDDYGLLHGETTRAKKLGFRAKLCIHPCQVAPVHAAFSPTTEEVEWAKKVRVVVKASNGAATTIEGKMVDLPLILKANTILESAGISD